MEDGKSSNIEKDQDQEDKDFPEEDPRVEAFGEEQQFKQRFEREFLPNLSKLAHISFPSHSNKLHRSNRGPASHHGDGDSAAAAAAGGDGDDDGAVALVEHDDTETNPPFHKTSVLFVSYDQLAAQVV